LRACRVARGSPFHEGADWVITLHDVSQGHYFAAIGLLPMFPASVGKTGIVLKHGHETLHVSAAAAKKLRSVPIEEWIQALESTRKLIRNMELAKITRPANYAAHHIVAANLSKFPSAVKAREILIKFGIDINNAANGVYLPAKFEAEINAAYHGSLHTKRYADELDKRISIAKSREDVLIILDKIRNELLRGRFPH